MHEQILVAVIARKLVHQNWINVPKGRQKKKTKNQFAANKLFSYKKFFLFQLLKLKTELLNFKLCLR